MALKMLITMILSQVKVLMMTMSFWNEEVEVDGGFLNASDSMSGNKMTQKHLFHVDLSILSSMIL